MIEQVALCPKNPGAARELLSAMGIDEWVFDHVSARGNVARSRNVESEADLSFNYQALGIAKELEVLHYTRGPNWMRRLFRPRVRVSHLGMHCSESDVREWRAFFAARNIPVAQELWTERHTNAAIAGKRRYHYVIFDTYPILGVDVKLIVRHDDANI